MKTKFKQTEIGMIPEDWEVKVVGGLVKINEDTINKNYPEKNIEYIDTSSVDNGHLVETQKLKLEEAPSRAKRILKDNDILISTVRPNLKHFFFIKKSKKNLVGSTGFAVISSKKINPNFLYYYLTADKYTEFLTSIADAHTSTYPSFNPNVIENSFCPYPNEDEQTYISKILSDLDSKIELNQQMNAALESIGQAIFKHWFIDFEFPNEEGKPYKSSGGEMVDSERGEIPEGWDIKVIADCGGVVCGKTPPTKNEEYYSGGIPFITIPDMRDNVFVIRTEKSLSEAGARSQSKKELPPFAVCVSCIATPGLVALASERSHTNQQINSIICNSGISPYFIFFLMTNKSDDIKTMGLGGTATLNLNTGDFSRIKLLVPPDGEMREFHRFVEPLFKKILENLKESVNLSAIRDSLLPKLMSG